MPAPKERSVLQKNRPLVDERGVVQEISETARTRAEFLEHCDPSHVRDRRLDRRPNEARSRERARLREIEALVVEVTFVDPAEIRIQIARLDEQPMACGREQERHEEREPIEADSEDERGDDDDVYEYELSLRPCEQER